MGNRRLFCMILAILPVVVGAGPAQAVERQLLYYNHAWGTLDRATADAIEHSPYLRRFADFEVRTTTGAGGKKWTGRYLRGQRTYLEIFGVGDVGGQDGELGAAALGLSTERDGDLETVTSRLVASGQTPVEFLQTRDFGDHKPVPWFDGLMLSEKYEKFAAWVMEFRNEYFADPRGKTGPAAFPGDVSRERYLPELYKDKMMRNISSVRIAVTARDLATTMPLLRIGGFFVRTGPGGVVATRGGTTIHLDKVTLGQTGLKRVEFELNRAQGRHVERLGSSMLVVGPGAHAVWTF